MRYSPTRKDPYFTDGAAHGRSLGGKAERNHLVSQPLAGTARAFEKSRDLWKAKYKTLQERLKAFRTEVRDLRRSRDRWRAKAEALEQETNRLRARLQQQVEQSPPRRAGGYNRS